MFEQLASPLMDYMGAKQTQRWEKQAVRTQMDFQERMSNTAYQRAMEDMRLAGINPIMVSKLGGASTPTGAKASSPDLGKLDPMQFKHRTQCHKLSLQKQTLI